MSGGALNLNMKTFDYSMLRNFTYELPTLAHHSLLSQMQAPGRAPLASQRLARNGRAAPCSLAPLPLQRLPNPPHQFHLLQIDGELIALHSWKLVVGFFALMICGALTAFGVGLFVMVQAVLFVMNISPVVAFPIMTIAGAMQQPLTTSVFLYNNKIPLKKTMVLSAAGCIGVLITIPVFTHLTVTWLHLVLLFILTYNFFTAGYIYIRSRSDRQYDQNKASLGLADSA